MIDFLVHCILCQDLCTDSMCAYIFGKVFITTAFYIFSGIITTAPHWRLLMYYVYF